MLTLDPQKPAAQALAIKNGRILAVGSDDIVDQLRGAGTEVRDLGRACVIPGFNDTHAHMEREGLKEQRLSLAGARSVDDILTQIPHLLPRTPIPGAWIVTMPIGDPPHYFDALSMLAEHRMPSRAGPRYRGSKQSGLYARLVWQLGFAAWIHRAQFIGDRIERFDASLSALFRRGFCLRLRHR